jgi:hypothetical protein
MKTPKASVSLVEKAVETIQGWVPIPFTESPPMSPGSSYTLQADLQTCVKGPYLFRFDDPQGVRVASINAGNCEIEGSLNPFDAALLIANTESAEIGDQFFPIDGPSLAPGNRFKVMVMNVSGRKRKIGLVVYAQPRSSLQST